jgi:hypothetical protein
MATLDIVARLQNQASPEAQKLAKDLGEVDKAAEGSNESVGGLGATLQGGLKAGLGVAVAGVGLLATGLGVAVGEAMEAEKIGAALGQTLETAGEKTNITADEVNALAGELSGLSAVEDDTIIAGQNMLIQLGVMSDEVLPRASQAMLDMSIKTGSVESAAGTLGKALGDFDGFTKLERQGIQFSDTQRELIAQFKEAGDMAGYQNVVLDAVAGVMGGQAAAAAQTLSGRVESLKIKFGDVAEAVGERLVPELADAAENAMPGIEAAIDSALPKMEKFAGWLGEVADNASQLGHLQGYRDEVYQLATAHLGAAESGEELAAIFTQLDKDSRGAVGGLLITKEAWHELAAQVAVSADSYEEYEEIVRSNTRTQELAYITTYEQFRAEQALAEQLSVSEQRAEQMERRLGTLSIAQAGHTFLVEATTGAYDYMIDVSIRNENRMEHYGETLGEVDEGQEDVTESARDWAGVLNGIVAGAMENSRDSISTIVGLYGDLEEAGGEWVTSTVNNSGRIATIHGQLMADLDEETKSGYQEILNTAAEGSAEWLAAYQALQGDLTQAQRNELVARIADLQAHSGETISVFTGDAEAVEEIQAQINEQWALIATGHRQMVVDILVQQAEMEGGFNRSIANVMVATGLMTQAEAELQLQTQETDRQIGLLGDAMGETFLEDGAITIQEAGLIEEAIAGVEDGSFTAGQVISAMARDGLGEFISQAGLATIEADRFLQQVLETEGDYQVNIHTNYTQSGEPPPGLGGGAVGGQGAGGGATGGGGNWQTGGFTGYGPVNEIAGVVHRNEYVLNAAAVGRLGLANLEAINAGQPASTGGDTIISIAIDARGSFDPAATEEAGYQGAKRALAEAGVSAELLRRTRGF